MASSSCIFDFKFALIRGFSCLLYLNLWDEIIHRRIFFFNFGRFIEEFKSVENQKISNESMISEGLAMAYIGKRFIVQLFKAVQHLL